MLRRLRLKFILTNMLLVTVVLLAVFGALMISTAQQLERESAAAMKLALRQDGIPPQLELHLPDQGGAREWRWAIPVFCVTIEADGTLTLEEGSQVKVTEDTLAQAVQEIQEAQAPSGTLQNLGLRFQQEQLSDGRVRIAFSDLSWERASLGRLMVNSLLIGGAALAVFFAISLFLARLSLKPVERAWTQQRQFVADASHELKTPLASIRLLADSILQNQEMDRETVQDFVSDIGEEAERLTRITEHLLSLTRLDSLPVGETYIVDLSAVGRRAVSMLLPVADAAQVTIETTWKSGCTLRCTEDDLYQICFNLIENAVKYNFPGGKVFVSTRRNGDQVLFEVADTGIGIPEEELPKVFNRFYRVDKARSRAAGGTGLGLSIVRDTVRRHGGWVTAQRREPEGSVFTVGFPCETPEVGGEDL